MKAAALAALAILGASQGRAQPTGTPPDESAAPFEGLWESHNHFGPEFAGELVVRRVGGRWIGSIAGTVVENGSVDLDFPTGALFRGTPRDGSGVIDGWWIQPPSIIGQAFATPVRLDSAGPGTWRGIVAPLPQTFTINLRIMRGEDGRWIGSFRNPEFNLGSSRLLATRSGSLLIFANPDGAQSREAAIIDDRSLRLAWPPLTQSLRLTRASPARRVESADPRAYRYTPPSALDDGWPTARASEVGFDEAALSRTIQQIIDADPFARRPQLIHSLLVARRGKLVLEEYFQGHDRETPHDMRSVGKSFASVLLGAAMRTGAPIGPETRIYELLGATNTESDPRRAQITLAHLMTHTSGLACNDNDETSPGGEDNMQSQTAELDWARFTLALPMAHAPGSRYAYCSGGLNLVGAALREATGRSVLDLFDQLIARPLRFGRYHWNLMPNGQAYFGGGMYLRPRDLLKIGQLYLNGGEWNGRRIVGEDWIARSTAANVPINEQTTGMSAETFASVATRGADGYAWHRFGVRARGRTYEAYEANGNGGQFLIVVPELDLAVVMTGGNYRQGGIWTRWRDEIVGAQIIAALITR